MHFGKLQTKQHIYVQSIQQSRIYSAVTHKGHHICSYRSKFGGLVNDVRCHHKRYPCVLPPRIPASTHNDRNMLFTSCSKCKGVSNSLTSPLANTITLQISNELGFAYYHILCPYEYKRTHSKVLNKHHLSISNQPICHEYSHCLI